jgi:microcystin-dependent protein
MWTTGDIKITLKSSPDTGWVFFDDGTIGSASSGASTRANADTEALFTLLWNFTTDSNCAVSSGRGVSAASDFAANKTIALPKVLGRALAVYGTGSGLTSRALADAIGSENAINVAHDHTATQASHTHTWEYTGGGAGATATVVTAGAAAGSAGGGPTAAAQPTITVASSGSSGSGANMQPTVFFNLMVKL